MARRYIEIEGQFAQNVLGTFNIIRGFATLQELAEISAPYLMDDATGAGSVAGHQRMVDEVHAQEIKDYFERGDRQFIPEIILSVRTELAAEVRNGEKLGLFTTAAAPTGLAIRRKHGSRKIRIHLMRVDRKALPALKAANVIRRIDGNHRLAKAHELRVDTGRPNQYLVPFCLILLAASGNTADDYSESLVFHSINSTAKPLDSEHALRLILGQPTGESMTAVQEFAYNPSLHLTRLLKRGFDQLPPTVRERFGSRPLTSLASAAREMLTAYPEKRADLIALQDFAVELLWVMVEVSVRLSASTAHADFCRCPFFVELSCHAWMRNTLATRETRLVATVSYLAQLADWLGAEGLRALRPDVAPGGQLVRIYDEVRRRIPKKVFLARWYPPDSEGVALKRANLRLDQIRRTLADLETSTGVALELIDFGTCTAPVIPIHPQMYEAVQSADIILVDLTGHRPNVCIEAGYALRHHDKRRLVFLFQPKDADDAVPFDLNTYRYEPISDAAEIPDKLGPVLRTILAETSLDRR